MATRAFHDKRKVRDHYDVVSPFYRELWGEHIHHGYWIRGDETKEQAQLQLIERLAQTAGIQRGCKILDIGCGLGGSAIYLAKHYDADVTGITISPVQVEMARRAATLENVGARFLLMDAETLDFTEHFNVLWCVESIAHYQEVAAFFVSAAKLLPSAGVLAITDWFKAANLAPAQQKKFIDPIQRSMLVKLHTVESYCGWIRRAGFRVAVCEILNGQCAPTWDITTDLIKDRKLWRIAARHGPDFLAFLKGFRAMRAAFASGAFAYGLLVAHKN